jgi:hypothetical protein
LNELDLKLKKIEERAISVRLPSKLHSIVQKRTHGSCRRIGQEITYLIKNAIRSEAEGHVDRKTNQDEAPHA